MDSKNKWPNQNTRRVTQGQNNKVSNFFRRFLPDNRLTPVEFGVEVLRLAPPKRINYTLVHPIAASRHLIAKGLSNISAKIGGIRSDGHKNNAPYVKEIVESIYANEHDQLIDAMLNSHTDTLMIADKQGYIRYVNKNSEKMTEISNDAVLGSHVFDLFVFEHAPDLSDSPDEQKTRVQNLRKIPYRGVVRAELKTKNGKRPVEIVNTPIFDNMGDLVCIIGSIDDKGKINDLNRKLKTIINNVPGEMVLVDKEHKILMANNRYLNTMQRFSGEVIKTGSDMREIASRPGKKIKHVLDIVEDVMKGGEEEYGEFEIGGADEKRTFMYYISPVKEKMPWIKKFMDRPEESYIYGYCIFTQDVTARKRIEEKTKKAELMLRTLIEGLNVGVGLISKEQKILVLNKRLNEHCKKVFKMGLVEGKTDISRIARSLGIYKKATEEGKSDEIEVEYHEEDGGYGVISLKLLPVVGENGDEGKMVGAVVLTEEITEKIVEKTMLEEALIKAELNKEHAEKQRDNAEKENRARIELTNRIVHDVKSPLSGVYGLNRLIIEEADEKYPDVESIKHYAKTCADTSADIMQDIVDILDAAKVDKGDLVVSKQEVGLREYIRYTSNIFMHKMKKKGMGLNITKESAEVLVGADTKYLKKVFVNIMDNAIKYSPDGSDIDIDIGTDGRYGYFEIEDHGDGMAKKDLDKIFDYLKQADNTKGIGYGIGLSNTKAFVDAMGGKIEVRSELGEGSAFKVSLPLTKQSERV